jgi:hypothetical protein
MGQRGMTKHEIIISNIVFYDEDMVGGVERLEGQ